MYNWEHKNWNKFTYNEKVVDKYAQKIAENFGELNGMQKTFDLPKLQEAIIRIMISEAQKTSEIEGEMLSRQDLMSSIKNRLGLSLKKERVKDKRAENVAMLMIQLRADFRAKLSESLIKRWHSLLFQGSKYINAGKYRRGKEPMQIVSGAVGREKVHYEAPPSERVAKEMKRFVSWYNTFKTGDNIRKIILKTAIAHLYFESIHPFEDGNGRIGRALIEKCLSESIGNHILIATATTIEKDKKQYYAALNKVSKTLQIDSWLLYFAKMLLEAQRNTIAIITFSIKKAHFFDRFKNELNERERKVVNKMFDAGEEGFKGGMTAKKYVSITKTSKATATRDLQHLSQMGVLLAQGDGRGAHYLLNMEG